MGATYLGPSYAMAQGMVPLRMRAQTVGIMLFVLNMIALGLGPATVGLSSVVLKTWLGADSLALVPDDDQHRDQPSRRLSATGGRRRPSGRPRPGQLYRPGGPTLIFPIAWRPKPGDPVNRVVPRNGTARMVSATLRAVHGTAMRTQTALSAIYLASASVFSAWRSRLQRNPDMAAAANRAGQAVWPTIQTATPSRTSSSRQARDRAARRLGQAVLRHHRSAGEARPRQGFAQGRARDAAFAGCEEEDLRRSSSRCENPRRPNFARRSASRRRSRWCRRRNQHR